VTRGDVDPLRRRLPFSLLTAGDSPLDRACPKARRLAHQTDRLVAEAMVVKVVGLWRYPVKSLRGERLESAVVTQDGVADDRLWGIRDERTGRILTARRRPELLFAAAAYDGEVPVITLPDGRVASGPGHGTDTLLSQWLGTPVSLVSSTPTQRGRAEYFADSTDDSSEAIEWTMPVGRYVDSAPTLVLTTASLRTAAALHPRGVWDPHRFRPNVLIEVDGATWLEDQWAGQPLRMGNVTLLPDQPCIRCTMVTRAQPGLDADVEVFRTLARHHRGHFGMWSHVLEAGTVTVGAHAVLGASQTAEAETHSRRQPAWADPAATSLLSGAPTSSE
jgi:uncharacterized protein